METTHAQRIKKIRKLNSISQKDFAEALEVTQATISQLESGKFKITAKIAQKINRIYNVDIGWLLYGEETSKRSILGEPALDYINEPTRQTLQIELQILNNKIVEISGIDISDNEELKEMIKQNTESIKALSKLVTSKL